MFDIAFKQDDGKLRSTFLGEKKKIAEGIVSFVYNDTNMRTLRNTLNNFEDKNQSEGAYLLFDKTTFEVKRCYELNVPTNAEKCFIESMPVITYDVPLDFVHKEMSGEYNNNLKDAPDNSYFVCMHTHPRFCAENDWDNLASLSTLIYRRGYTFENWCIATNAILRRRVRSSRRYSELQGCLHLQHA